MKIIGVDVGGTFTDIILEDTDTGKQLVHKVPSTPTSQDKAVVTGITELLEREKFSPSEIDMVVHGTTVATNAMLERKGAKVCLITTAGFEDVLEIGRQNRIDIYDICAQRPSPLVEREYRFGVEERVDWEGNIIHPLLESEITRAKRVIQDKKPDAIAISFLFSFLNSNHELQISEALRNDVDAYIVASSQVLPEFREYERTSTTVLEAYLGPLVLGYLESLDVSISSTCPKSKLTIMQSNGGTVLGSKVGGKAIGLAISGLAGGVIGGWDIAKQNGVSHALTLDMGGTSCDISAIIEGVAVTADNDVAGLPLRFPSVDVKTIGAGGGSIAWIDEAGVLHVGPQSAGADPGPVSYGKGGKQVTVTDASLILGRLNAEFFVGGEIQLDTLAAKHAIEHLGKRLNLSIPETALGIIRISTANMVQAIREVTIERGNDPRDFVLIPFGGAGPTQACDIAESLGMDRVLIPPYPGITSAYGLICADLRIDLVKSVVMNCDIKNESVVREAYTNLCQQAVSELVEQGAKKELIEVRFLVDMRYKGQSHELTIPIPSASREISRITMERFEKEHQSQFGYRLDDRTIEWVSIRVVANTRSNKKHGESIVIKEKPYNITKRRVILNSGRCSEVTVHRREEVEISKKMVGPLIIEQLDTTVWVGEKWSAERKENDIIWLRRDLK